MKASHHSLLHAIAAGHVQYLGEALAELVQYEALNVLLAALLKLALLRLRHQTAGSGREDLVGEDVEGVAEMKNKKKLI